MKTGNSFWNLKLITVLLQLTIPTTFCIRMHITTMYCGSILLFTSPFWFLDKIFIFSMQNIFTNMYILSRYTLYLVSDLDFFRTIWNALNRNFQKAKNVLHSSRTLNPHYLLKISSEPEELVGREELTVNSSRLMLCKCSSTAQSILPPTSWLHMRLSIYANSQPYTHYFHIKVYKKELCWYPPRT